MGDEKLEGVSADASSHAEGVSDGFNNVKDAPVSTGGGASPSGAAGKQFRFLSTNPVGERVIVTTRNEK